MPHQMPTTNRSSKLDVYFCHKEALRESTLGLEPPFCPQEDIALTSILYQAAFQVESLSYCHLHRLTYFINLRPPLPMWT